MIRHRGLDFNKRVQYPFPSSLGAVAGHRGGGKQGRGAFPQGEGVLKDDWFLSSWNLIQIPKQNEHAFNRISFAQLHLF